MNCKGVLAVVTGALALSACAQHHSARSGHIDPADFGEANRQTMLAQVVDPYPVYDEPLATSGEHAQQAAERYRTDRVKQPPTIRTSSSDLGATGGGSSTGSGGS
jgi:hypothetical protein